MRPVRARRLARTLPLLIILLLGSGLASGWGGGLAAAPAPRSNAEGTPAPLGGALAWGRDTSGQLGDGAVGAPPDISTPQAVALSSTSAFTAMTAGGQHSLGLLADGTLLAWGADQFGQLGDGTVSGPNTAASAQAVPIPSGSGVIAIAAGGGHSLALLADGTLLAWGNDENGQLGDGTVGGPDTCNGDPACHATPQAVLLPAGARVTTIAAGNGHSLALLADGTVLAWGDDDNGQLGDSTAGGPDNCGGDPNCHAMPHAVALPASARATAVAAAGKHSLALLADGTVLAWGNDFFGILGDGTAASPDFVATPQAVLLAAGARVTAIAAGELHNLALLADGTVLAWGRDGFGSLGDGVVESPDFAATPQAVLAAPATPLSDVAAIAAGEFHSLALKADGTIVAWGLDNFGQVGDGTAGGPDNCSGLNCHATPQAVLLPSGVRVTAIAAGGLHSLALVQASQVGAWGADDTGQLGDGTIASPSDNPMPLAVPGLTDIVAVSAGGNHSLALKRDGTVLAWGRDTTGDLGDGTAGGPNNCGVSGNCVPTPQPVIGVGGVGVLSGIVAISAGSGFSLALRADGRIIAWGDDFDGQLGDGTPTTSGCGCHAIPQLVSVATNVVAISAGGNHSLALKVDGTVLVWGSDFFGQLGDSTAGSPNKVATPQPVSLPAGAAVTAIAAGLNHNVVLRADGTLLAWGIDTVGELGDGTAQSSGGCTCHAAPQPVLLPAGTQIVAIAAGGNHNLALKPDGTLLVWGRDSSGQLGDGSPTAAHATPQPVPGVSGVVAMDGGFFHSLVLKADGTLMSWSVDNNGELGDSILQPVSGCACHPNPQRVPGVNRVAAIAVGAAHNVILLAAPAPTATTADDKGAIYGDSSVGLTATVTSAAGTVNSGPVTFTVKNASSATIGAAVTGQVDASGIVSATFTIPPGTPAGNYTIEAVYGGALSFNASSDATPAALTITKAATNTTIGTITTLPSCGSANMTVPVTVANTSNSAVLTGGNVTVTLTQGATTVGTGSAAVSGASSVTVDVSVALSSLGAGTVNVNASYSGNGNFQGSNATSTSFASPLTGTTVTVPNATATYGDTSVTLTATVASANGGALTGGAVTFVVRQGTQVIATLSSGPVVGASPVTVGVTLPLNASHGARTYSVTATYSGNACFATDDGTGTLTVGRKILWLKPQDRTVGLHQPNPPTVPHGDPACPAPNRCMQLANGSSFAYGQSWADLNLTQLRFQYNRNPPATNASETVGKTYKITAFGVASTNYDIRYQQGTLTVVQP